MVNWIRLRQWIRSSVYSGRRFLFFLQEGFDFLDDFNESFRRRRVRVLDYERCALVGVHAYLRVYRNAAEKLSSCLFRHLFSAPRLEYVDFFAAVGADESAHVFNNAYYGHAQSLGERDCFLDDSS